MRVDQYFSRRRVVELGNASLKGCLKELIEVTAKSYKDLHGADLLPALLQRESTITTYLGHGVAMPHTRVEMKRRFVFAIGRSREGIDYDGPTNSERVHLVILLLAGKRARGYLNVLASVARLMSDQAFVKSLVEADNLDILFDRLSAGFVGILALPPKPQRNNINKLLFAQALRTAKGVACESIAVFGDTMESMPIKPPDGFRDFKTVLITRRAKEADFDSSTYDHVIQVRSFSRGRLAQARAAFLVGLTRKIFTSRERICCIGGIPSSDQFDTLVVFDMGQEFHSVLAGHENILPSDVSPEVLERVIGIAMELAVEGREGHAVGTLFVLGGTKAVNAMTKPLVLNPFFGYSEEDRNVLSPFMDETVKEYASLDGAFVVRGDGVLISAGSLIHAPDYYHSLPSGLGSRHAAAAAISLATDCLSIVVSSSTGQVTVFRNGIPLPLMEKALGQ